MHLPPAGPVTLCPPPGVVVLSSYQSDPSLRLPCSELVARWVASCIDPTVDPVAPDWDTGPGRDAAVRAVGVDAWRGLVVSGGDVWSCPDTAARLLGGRLAWYPSVTRDTVVRLGRGVHVVQRWRGLAGAATSSTSDDAVRAGASGHAYLVCREGGAVWVFQSSTSRGVRCTSGTWEGAAGLEGYAVRVASLSVGR